MGGNLDTHPGITPEGGSLAPLVHAQSADTSLWELVSHFTGNQYRFLVAFLRDPDQPHNAVARAVGLTPESVYNWRYAIPGFKDALDAIREHRPQLRQEYAKLAFEGAIPDLADAMIERGKGQGVAAQRAAERILETVGVLPKDTVASTGPIVLNVVYYTTDADGRKVVDPPRRVVAHDNKVIQLKALESPERS